VSKSCGISNICKRKHAHIHSVTDPTTGEVICISCGTVISDGIAENRPERSIIDINELYSGSRTGMHLGDYRTRTRSSKDQSCIYAFRQLNKLKEKLALPSSVIEKAAYIYRKAQRNEIAAEGLTKLQKSVILDLKRCGKHIER
jgi:transcription initiation factor TFIIB